jgi:hypothetical protein
LRPAVAIPSTKYPLRGEEIRITGTVAITSAAMMIW